MKKTIVDFRAFMKVAHQEARQYIKDVIELWDELNGSVSGQLDIAPDWSTGMQIQPLHGVHDWYHFKAISPGGIWAVPQRYAAEEPRFFAWEDLDHENDVLAVAEFVQDIAMKLFTDPGFDKEGTYENWNEYQRRLGREVLKPKSIFE